MLAYLLRRLLLALVTIWAITVVTFVIIQLPPGDFVDAYVAQSAAMGSAITMEEAAALRQAYGLDQCTSSFLVDSSSGDPHRQDDVLLRRQHRHEVEELEDEAEVVPTKICQFPVVEGRDLCPLDPDLPARGTVEPGKDVHQRRLSRP